MAPMLTRLRQWFRARRGPRLERTDAPDAEPITIYGGPPLEASVAHLHVGRADFPLDPEGIFTIGSLPGNHLCVAEAGRRHCGIKGADGHFELADFGSTCGTLVNGKKVTRVRLAHGDRIQVATVELVFRAR